jgi:molybdopterin converting factor small subunit
MARLRLFANLREAAGSASVEIEGSSVGEVLANASTQFGSRFEKGLAAAQVWVNGEQAGPDTPVGDGDEVALIPPVSGGATTIRSPVGFELGIVVVTALVLFIANAASVQWLTVAVVLAASVWAFDIVEAARSRDLAISFGPIILAVVAGALATYRWGGAGMAGATTGAGLGALVWSIVRPRLRPVDSLASGTLLAITAAFGTSAVVLLRLRSEDEATAFLIVAVASVALAWFAAQADIPGLDSMVVGSLAAVGAGVAAGLILLDDLVPTLIAALAAAVALVAGRTLGSLMRAGGFFLSGPMPGSLHFMDGLMVAAGPFWLMLRLFAS